MSKGKPNRRIWIDVTDFLRWEGNFTGFQHIQYNMAKEFLADKRDVHFFVHSEPSHSFREVDFDPALIAKDGIALSTPDTDPSRARLEAIKRRVPNRLKKVLKKVNPARASVSDSPFVQDDLVIVLGGIWHGSFADDITNEKRHKGFVFVHIVHDMIPVRVPAYVVADLPAVFGTYKEKIFKHADALIINSESSRNDALSFMRSKGIAAPPSMVFRIADDPAGQETKVVKGVKKDAFILSMGTIEGRKNHALLYYMYKQALRQGIDLPQLVIAGRIGWLTEDIRYMIEHDPEVKGRILIRTSVTNSERAWLYTHCLFTVWPSFYEGWGMPVAESVAYGKVCLSSDTSSMKEIAGDLNEYFSPFDPVQCLSLVQKYLDSSVRYAQEKRIRKEYQATSWNDMYRTIVSFIDTL